MSTITYGTEWGIELSMLPESSLAVLVQRTVNHIMGNEVAAKVKAWRDEASPVPNDAEIAAYTHDARMAQWARIVEGKLGIRTSAGPRLDTFESLIRALAVEKLKINFKKLKVAMPTGDKTVDVQGRQLTRDQLIDEYVAKHRETLEEKAEERMAQQRADMDSAEDLFS